MLFLQLRLLLSVKSYLLNRFVVEIKNKNYFINLIKILFNIIIHNVALLSQYSVTDALQSLVLHFQ